MVNKKLVIGGVIVGVVAIIFLSAIFTGRMGSFTGGVVSSNCRNVEVPYEAQEEYMKTEYYTETVPYTGKECETKQLVYNVKDFVIDYQRCDRTEDRCLKYFLGICSQKETYCVLKSISCSLDINNLDSENGYWNFNFEFKETISRTIAETNSRASPIYPQSSQHFQASASFEGREKAEKDYTCSYSFTNIPTKQVCRDVIKYKDIQKERQVTAYKPVTKYRTEQKCN